MIFYRFEDSFFKSRLLVCPQSLGTTQQFDTE